MIHLRKIVWLLAVACFVLVVGALAALIKYDFYRFKETYERVGFQPSKLFTDTG